MTTAIFNRIFRTLPGQLFVAAFSSRFRFKKVICKLTDLEYLLCLNYKNEALSIVRLKFN